MLFFRIGTALVIEGPVMICRQEASQRWPSATGQILFVTHSLRGGTSVRYAYEVGGQYVESSTGLLPHIKRAQLIQRFLCWIQDFLWLEFLKSYSSVILF